MSVSETALHVDPDRLRRELEELARIGGGPDGEVNRPALDQACLRARAWLRERMEAAGLRVRTDPAANLFGRRSGTDSGAPAILAGSHLDTVPRGGRFDGALGCLAALEAVRTMAGEGFEPTHPVEVVAWTDEEGHRFGPGLFGSRAAAGAVDAGELSLTDPDGVVLRDALRRAGGDPERIDEARLDPGSVAAYLELHVEQGPVLHRAGESVGVVEGIVGISRWEVTVVGAANHAGTTPMDERRDALVAAGRLAAAARDRIRSEVPGAVGNVGWIRAEPGAANVVPGRTTLPLEVRSLDQEVIESLARAIRSDAERIADEEGVEVSFRRVGREPPALTDPWLRDALAAAARELGVAYRRMPSGAGHDAQALARTGLPTGMIFVPSTEGVSHSPREHTTWEDCALGAEVLYRALLRIDRRPPTDRTEPPDRDDP